MLDPSRILLGWHSYLFGSLNHVHISTSACCSEDSRDEIAGLRVFILGLCRVLYRI